MAGKLHLTEERKELTLKLARYIITTHSSIRSTATVFGIGKTMVQWYIDKYLPLINKKMHEQIKKIWQLNANDSTRIANNQQQNNKSKRKERIKEYIVNKILVQDGSEEISLTYEEIGKELEMGKSTVHGLMTEILAEEDCDFITIKKHDKNITRIYYKLKIDNID